MQDKPKDRLRSVFPNLESAHIPKQRMKWQSKFLLCGGGYAVVLCALAGLAPFKIAVFYIAAMASLTTLALLAHLLYHQGKK